jgi:peptidoglycan hydrolase-like protein with peptidoglycan-binding domain
MSALREFAAYARTFSPADANGSPAPAVAPKPNGVVASASKTDPSADTAPTAPAGPPANPGQQKVMGIQRALQKCGYDPGPINGAMGPSTQAAIAKLQQANGLPADGRLNQPTQAALAKELKAKAAAAAGGLQTTNGQTAAVTAAPGSGGLAAPSSPGDGQDAAAVSKLSQAPLAKAPEIWTGALATLDAKIKALKDTLRSEFAGEGPEITAGIEKAVAKLDVILDKLDGGLADSLAKAHAAQDPAARQAALDRSKSIVADFMKYVNTEPLIAHIDANPLGVQTNLGVVLKESLQHVASAIA